MRVFVTGATGFIGMAVTKDLIANGHKVVGLCRSRDKAGALAALGAEIQEGTLEDLAGLKAVASRADGVIHLAFNHDFSRYVENCEDDRRVIEALGAALAGSGRPLVITSGTAIARAAAGKPGQEDDPAVGSDVAPRAASEEAATAAARNGVAVSVVRLPQVHDTTRQGFVSLAILTYREKGICGYVGEGLNRWPAAHVLDVARLYRLALEKAAPHANYHAVGEEGVRIRDIAETLGKRLKLPVKSIAPEDAAGFFGFMAMFAALDMPASSEKTRKALNWRPTGPGMLEDLARLEFV